MANFTFKSNRTEIQNQMTENFAEAAEMLKEDSVEWVQHQMLYGYKDPHGPDGHTEIVDTGALFESLQGEVKRDSQNAYTVTVGSDKKYAVFVHNGTRKLRARPFIRDALELHREDIRRIMSAKASEGFK